MELLSQELLANIGMVAIVAAIILAVTLFIGLIFAYTVFKNRKIVRFLSSKSGSIIVKVLVFILDLLYLPARKIISILGGNDKMIDAVNIDLRNMLLKNKFSEVPYTDRVAILPQCLRDLNCPVRFSSVGGAQCAGCGKCKIFEITKKAEDLGYKGTYITPGGGFVRRTIKKIRPKAIVGVGCPSELNWAMVEFSNKGLLGQGVILLRDGCVETDVDLEEVFHVMEMHQNGSGKNKGA
jgi:hypothetical protein